MVVGRGPGGAVGKVTGDVEGWQGQTKMGKGQAKMRAGRRPQSDYIRFRFDEYEIVCV